MTVTIGYIWEVYLRLSNLSFFLSAESRESCAQRHTFSHTFRVLRASKALHPWDSPSLSPGPLLPATSGQRVAPYGELGPTVRAGCTQGVYTRHIQGSVYPAYTRVGIPGSLPYGVYQAPYPMVYTRLPARM